jgi:uncharacterized protein (DUF342 family)
MEDNQVTKDQDYKDEVNNGSALISSDKVISIVDNRIVLKVDPIDKFPVIRSDKKVNLYVDGKKREDPIIVSNEVEITIETIDQSPHSSVDIKVTNDKLKAYLIINKQVGKRLCPILIKDPYNVVDFVITTKEEVLVDDNKINQEEISKKIRELNIKFGLNSQAVSQAIENPGKKFLIAEGKPPVESIDARIDYVFKKQDSQTNEGKTKPTEVSGKIDYFGFREISSVRPGQVLAIKKPPRYGKPGINIFGEEIPVQEPKDIEWNIGERVTIIGNKAVALKSGRPVINKGKLSIFNIYYVEKDVDISVGSINYNGDVTINGDVCDNFSVIASGVIKVGRNVSHAKIESGGSICIDGSVISSRIIAGGLAAYHQRIESNFQNLYTTFVKVEKSVFALKKEDLFKKLSERELIFGLFETKYKSITEIINELLEYQAILPDDLKTPELLSVINELKIFLDTTNLDIDLTLLGVIKRKVGKVCRIYKDIINTKASIQTSYIQNSIVQATGDIIINNEGAFNSTLDAGGKVIINGIPGVFRGGKIKAHKAVIVRELGSIGGSRVEVQVAEDGKITAEKVYDNVYIKVGGRFIKLNKEMKNITARLDSNGQIILT